MLMAAQHPPSVMGSAGADGREATEDFLLAQRPREDDDGNDDDDGGGTTSASSLSEGGKAAVAATTTAATTGAATDAEGLGRSDGGGGGRREDRATTTTEGGVAASSRVEVPPLAVAAASELPAASVTTERMSTPPPPEEAKGNRETTSTPPRPFSSPLHYASTTPRSSMSHGDDDEGSGATDLKGRVEELERTVAALLDALQAQRQQGSGGDQLPLAPRTPLRTSLRPTPSQLCLHPLDSPSPTPRSNKVDVRRRIVAQQGVISMPDLNEDSNVDAIGAFVDGDPRLSFMIAEPTPDLEYRTYTAEYEEELKKIRADRQRGMSFDVADVVERKLREEAEADADVGLNYSSDSSKSASSQGSRSEFSSPQSHGKKRIVVSTRDDGIIGSTRKSVPKRNRSTGELRKLDEQPTTPRRRSAHFEEDQESSSPKGVEEGPSSEERVKLKKRADPAAATTLLSARGEARNEKCSGVAESLPEKQPAVPPPTSSHEPSAAADVSSQKNDPQKLATKRKPTGTVEVVPSPKQDKETEKGPDVVQAKRNSKAIRRNSSSSSLKKAAKKVTPKGSKKSTPQPKPQKKTCEPAAPPPKVVARPPPVQSMFSYIKNEMLSNMNIDSSQQDGSFSEDVDTNMQEFIRVPSRLENLLFFGLAICTDSFLYLLAFLPLKFLWSCVCLFCTILRPGKGIRGCRFRRRHLYQILLMLIIYAVYSYVLLPISIGKLYHWIRGQAMIKLYVMIAIVEVFDRLMCSLGQDSLDSLYWNTTRRPYHHRMVISTCVVFVYAAIHSFILYVHIATLNVAMNSSDQALLSLLIGGNFAEIKSTVFKKYNKQNLFKITTSDICERFKLILFLTLILVLNCFQGGMTRTAIQDFIKVSGVVMAAEMMCDWIKHSFITKFNFIKSSAYPDYALILAGDVTGVGHEGINLNNTHAVVKRLGFSQIPLVCVTARYIREALRYGMVMSGENGTGADHFFERFAALYTNGNWSAIAAIVLGVFHCLLVMKIVLGYSVLRSSQRLLDGPTPPSGDDGSKKRPTEKPKEMTAGESAQQEKNAAPPRRQAV